MLQCVHGDVRAYHCTEVTLTMGRREEPLMVGLAPTLAYPIILGRDSNYFGELLVELLGPRSTVKGPYLWPLAGLKL